MTIKLYEFSSSRSARVRWTLQELEIPFESATGTEAFQSEEFRRISPLLRIPAIVDGDRSLFESSAICTWLADSHPEKALSFSSGTWERALHDQWVSFTLTELEAYIWSTFRNQVRYREDRRIPEIIGQNSWEAKKALTVFNTHLDSAEYMVAGRFSVTDIIVAYALNWSTISGIVEEEHAGIRSYLERMHERPHCCLKKPKQEKTA